MKPIAIFVVSILILSGCQTTDYIGNENSPRYRIPVGSTLILNQTLTIPAEQSSIYLFRGKVVTYDDVDIYYPHCQFRMKNVGKQVRTVKPDTFVVTKINDWEDYHAQGPQRYSNTSISIGVEVGMGANVRVIVGAGTEVGDRGPSIIKYATIISLQSSLQSEAKDIICAHWGDMGNIKAVTIKETRGALGDVFTLNIKSI